MVKVLVTGVTSFVAGPIVQQLLEQGHTVVGTLRSVAKGQTYRTQFPQYADRLFFEKVPDISVDGCFDHVFAAHPDIARVAHVASPVTYDYEWKNVDEAIFNPALRGTLSLMETVHRLNQAGKTKIERVVVTSSYAAVLQALHDRYPGTPTVNEDMWTPLTRESIPEGDKLMAYVVSKKLAEKSVYDFLAAHPDATFTVTTLCLPIVLGPPAVRMPFSALNLSQGLLTPFIDSDAKIRPLDTSFWVDVRDAGKAHVKALLDLSVGINRRWLVMGGYISMSEYVEAAQALPETYSRRVSRNKDVEGAKAELINRPKLDNSRSAAEMQIEFTPVAKSSVDAFKYLIDAKDAQTD